ncbi:MAG: carboxypeptidase regulatory-like domain-containing protein [Candidatus Hydrogenedentes bacterium]|nr:carboxypeptidase regulatory-like domain-containing protein [Candidatus Hydrogenedentota bacterium]
MTFRRSPSIPVQSVATVRAFLVLVAVLCLRAQAVPADMVWTDSAPLNTNAAGDSGSDESPRLMTDGAGNWVAVWYSTDSLGGTIGNDEDIFVARSTDNGATWTAPTPLNANASTDSGYDREPQVETDGAGNWVVVWWSNDALGGTIGTDADILVSRSTDNGASWTDPVPLNANAATDSGDDFNPQVTTDGAGNWVAVWHSNDSLGGTINTDQDILVARSTDNGTTWTVPVPLNTNAATDLGADVYAQVATDKAGSWVVVWQSSDSLGGTIGSDYDILAARSSDNGATWTGPAPLNTNAATDSGGDWNSHVATDGAGSWIVVWRSNDSLSGTLGTDYDILVARSTDDGLTWADPAPLNSNAATDSRDDREPRVTTDGAGNWVAVWYSWDSLGGTIGTDTDILVARSTDNGTTWTDPAPLNSNAATDFAEGDLNGQVTTDGAGNWMAVWEYGGSLGGTFGSDHDIFSARAAFTGSVHGIVRDADTDVGLSCAAVRVTSLEGDVERVSTTDVNGEYQVINLPSGDYRVEVFSPGYSGQSAEATITDLGQTEANLGMTLVTGEGVISGLVTVEASGKPLGGVRVDARIGGEIAATTYTCAEGRYELRGLVAKATMVTLEFSAFGYMTKTTEIELSPGETKEVNAALTPKVELSGSLAGVVRDVESGDPIPGARVTATKAAVGPSVDADTYGQYYLGELTSGVYQVVVSDLKHVTQTTVVAVFAGAVPTVADFSLEPAAARQPSDLDSNGVVNAVDVQLVINAALGLHPDHDCDVNKDQTVNAVDVQLVINAALGLT